MTVHRCNGFMSVSLSLSVALEGGYGIHRRRVSVSAMAGIQSLSVHSLQCPSVSLSACPSAPQCLLVYCMSRFAGGFVYVSVL